MNHSITIQDVLKAARGHGACSEALEWLEKQTDAETAWQTCERPDWMIWLATRRDIDRKIVVRIACDCARTSLRFVPAGEERPRLAIEAAVRWIGGEATIKEVRAAADAAYAYADAAYAAYAAAYAADAAAYAADAAAYAAAYAADAAAYAAADAAAYADREQTRQEANRKMCAIVHKHISFSDIARTF